MILDIYLVAEPFMSGVFVVVVVVVVKWLILSTQCSYRDANINIQKIGRIQTKNRDVFKITCNFNSTKLARNRDFAKFGCQNGTKMFTKYGASILNRKGWHLCNYREL